jgi:hypothetical protein
MALIKKNLRIVALKNLYDHPFIIWQHSRGTIINHTHNIFLVSFTVGGYIYEYKLDYGDKGILWDFDRYQPMCIFN